MAQERKGAREGDPRGEKEAPAQEAHENRLYSLSEREEISHWSRGS